MASNLKQNVSVISTVYNEEKNINKFLKSLVTQSLKPKEIIIVDARSTDNTASLIREFQKKNKYGNLVKLYAQKGNRSVGRNFGIGKAASHIIAVTDAGCYAEPKWLELIVKSFRDPSITVVSGYYKADASTPFEKAVAPYFLVMEDKLSEDIEFFPSSRSVAFRKKVWEKTGGYPEEYSHNEDLVFDYAMKNAGYKFHFEKGALVYWYPPEDIWKAARQFFRFALGDAEANIKRPRVKYIFLRYVLLLEILTLSIEAFYVFVGLYSLWSIQKNFKYAKMVESVLWLPIIQFVSDIAVMSGYVVGKAKRYWVNR